MFLGLSALALPALTTFDAHPLPSFYNQVLALLLWGAWIYAEAQHRPALPARDAFRPVAGFAVACGLLAATHLVSSARGWQPWGPTACTVFVLAAAVVVAGWSASLRPAPADHGAAAPARVFIAGLALAGVLNCIPAAVQLLRPDWIDGHWIAQAYNVDRISGNVRQPNLLATSCAWGLAAVVALHALRRLPRAWAWAAMALLTTTIAATGSRIGVVEVLLLSAWGLVDRRLDRSSRLLLIAAPAGLVLGWLLVSAWTTWAATGLRARPPEVASGRWALWRQCLTLIAAHPWSGVGAGQFNFAWTLTPFDRRANPETFDHAHDLLLQWAVELGLPLTLVLVALLAGSLRRCLRLARRAVGEDAIVRRFALAIVVLVLVHALTEYPLSYAYFLLPTAFAWGLAAAPLPWERAAGPGREKAPRPRTAPRASPGWLPLCGLAMGLGAALAVYDYQKIVTVFHPWDGAPPVEQRIADGRRAWLYGPLADRFAGTLAEKGTRTLAPYRTATRRLLDTRLLSAWALALEEHGERDKARYLAARIADFDDLAARQFLAPCRESPPRVPAPWQCAPPTGRHGFEDFL